MMFTYNVLHVKEDIKDIPFDKCVYWLFDFSDKLIYIGKSDNIKDRLIHHFNNPSIKLFSFSVLSEDDFPKENSIFEHILLFTATSKRDIGVINSSTAMFVSKAYNEKKRIIENELMEPELSKKVKDIMDNY